jgi:hypothetical protein
MRRLGVAVLLAILAACGDPAEPAGVDVSNRRDNFSFRLEDVADYSGTFRYIWEHTGTTATVSINAALADGIGTIQITDGEGAQVYTGDVLESGSVNSDPGEAGDWAINIILVRVAGTLDLSVRKAN